MKNLLQRSIAVMLALVMAVSTPAIGLTAHATPTVSDNTTAFPDEDITETTSEERSSENIPESTDIEEISTPEDFTEEETSQERNSSEEDSMEEGSETTVTESSTIEESSITTETEGTTEEFPITTETEDTTEEESSEEMSSPDINQIMSDDESPIDLSLLSKITFDCNNGDIFFAEITSSNPEATFIHHTPEDEETTETVFYNNHILYTDSDITVSITPFDDYWAYTDKLEVAITDLTTMETTTELITFTEKIDATYSFLLPVDLTKHYSVRPILSHRYSNFFLETMNAAHADILVETEGITKNNSSSHSYTMDCSKTDSFIFAIKNSEDYNYTASYKNTVLTADTLSKEGYLVFSIKNDPSNAATLIPKENLITITETSAPAAISFEYIPDDAEITVEQNGMVLKSAQTNPLIYSLQANEPVTLSIKAKENCTVDNVELSINDGEKTKVTLDRKNTYTFTPNQGNNYAFSVTSTAYYSIDTNIYDEARGDVISAKNKVYLLRPWREYSFHVYKGSVRINEYDIKTNYSPGSPSGIQVNTRYGEKFLMGHPRVAGYTYTIDIYSKPDSGEKEKLASFFVLFTPLITDKDFTITGAKVKNGVTTITQDANSRKEYKLKLSGKGKDSPIDVLSAVSSNEDLIKAYMDNGNLVISTKAKTESDLKELNTTTVSIYDPVYRNEDDTKRLVKTITVNLTKSSLENASAPTLKLMSATDTTLNVKVTAPKKVSLEQTEGGLYYVLFVKPISDTVSGNDNPYGAKAFEYWVPANQSSVTVPLQVMNGISNEYGYEGIAADFNISAVIVNTVSGGHDGKQSYGYIDTVDTYYGYSVAAKTASAKKFSTKKPSYATNMTIKQQKKTLYISDINYSKTTPIPVATVSLDKNETYSKNGLGEYQFIDTSAAKNKSELFFFEQNGTIYLNGGNYTKDETAFCGKHTIQVTAPGPKNGKNLTKTFTIEIKSGIYSMSIESITSIYKAKDKTATIKPTVRYVEDYYMKDLKSTKLNWSILVDDKKGNKVPLEEYKEHYLYGYLTINKKNGTVTLKKDFIVSEENSNEFYIHLSITDEPHGYTVTQKIVITTKAEIPDRLVLLSFDYDKQLYETIFPGKKSLTAGELFTADICALRKGAPIQDTYTLNEKGQYFISNYLYTSKSNKILQISYNRIGGISGLGNNISITATASDGSGWKKTLSGINIGYAKDKLGFVIYAQDLPSGFTLSNDKCVQRGSYIYVPTDTTISYPGALIEDLYIHVGYLTEDGNIDILNWENSESKRKDFWNYQVKAKTGCKIMSAKDYYNNLTDFYLYVMGCPDFYASLQAYLSVGDYIFTNMNPTSVIQLSDKSNNNTLSLTFKNTEYEQLSEAPKITASTLYVDQTENQTLKLSIEGYDPNISEYDSIELNEIVDGYKSSATASTYQVLLNATFYQTSISKEGVAEYTIRSKDLFESGMKLKPGTYTFGISFYQNNQYTFAKIKPTKVTIKLEKPKTVKGSFKPTTKYTVNTVSGNEAFPIDEIVKKEIAFGGSFTGTDVQKNGVSTRTMTVNNVQSINTKGTFNKFFDYFEWNTQTAAFSLKDTITAEDLAYLKNKLKDEKGKIIKSDTDRKCYVTYTATYGLDTNGLPFEVTKTVLVTIDLK